MTVVGAFNAISDEDARTSLERYFGLGEWAGGEYTGAYFDTFGKNAVDAFTADDLLSVACLSVHVPARAALGILDDPAGDISDQLGNISNVLELQNIPLEEHDKYFGDGSPCQLLWRLLRAHEAQPWGVGATIASKLMARKRPALIPIYDSVVSRVTGFKDSAGTWRAWHEAFATNAEFVKRLESLRSAVQIEHISLLRILDIVLWMHGTRGVASPESVGPEVG